MKPDLAVAVRGSEVQDFLRCRWRWNARWNEMLQARRTDHKLHFGTIFHKWLEVWHKTLDKQKADNAMSALCTYEATKDMEQVEIDETLALAQNVADHYSGYWRERDSKWKVIASELTFAVPIDEHVVYTGTIDMIAHDEDANLWFWDHKTTDHIDKYENASNMDRQISRYWWALQQLAQGNGYIVTHDGQWIPCDRWYEWNTGMITRPFGFIYNLVKKDFPRPPRVLKSGALSKDKTQRTSYGLYMQAIYDMRLDPEDYADMIAHLTEQETENGNRFVKRVSVDRLQPEIDAAIHEFYYTVRDMQETRNAIQQGNLEKIYRNITHDCSWDCEYKPICTASMDGSNVDLLLDLLYERSDEHGFASTDETSTDEGRHASDFIW